MPGLCSGFQANWTTKEGLSQKIFSLIFFSFLILSPEMLASETCFRLA